MRLVWTAALVGCYDPRFSSGGDCAPGGACPGGLECVDGICVVPGTTPDGTIADAPDEPDAPPELDGPVGPDATWADAGAAGVFMSDGATLAILELDGNADDTSGNGRHATVIGGAFEPSVWDQALRTTGDPQGLDWSPHAALLVHPYTIELVATPTAMVCFQKLFGFNDADDGGWYTCDAQFQAYPNPEFTVPGLVANERHYWAVVSTGAAAIDVYFQGALVGSTAAAFTAPPPAVILFRDDSSGGAPRSEVYAGAIEAIRLSSTARTGAEIAAIQARLVAGP